MNSSDELEIVRTTNELLAFASESKRSKLKYYFILNYVSSY
jgi:hypothetical protein